jgi:hypothetical protein
VFIPKRVVKTHLSLAAWLNAVSSSSTPTKSSVEVAFFLPFLPSLPSDPAVWLLLTFRPAEDETSEREAEFSFVARSLIWDVA